MQVQYVPAVGLCIDKKFNNCLLEEWSAPPRRGRQCCLTWYLVIFAHLNLFPFSYTPNTTFFQPPPCLPYSSPRIGSVCSQARLNSFMFIFSAMILFLRFCWMLLHERKRNPLGNGVPKGPISTSRGLRQEDLLFPYLFLLCIEELVSLLKKSTLDKSLEGVQVCRCAHLINHILFVDDSLIFCKANFASSQRLLAC